MRRRQKLYRAWAIPTGNGWTLSHVASDRGRENVGSMIWQTARGALDLGTKGIIMGILNVTPDSFSDGGTYYDTDRAVAHAIQMWEDGAGIIDIGGESTRPGAVSVVAQEERRRVVPVIERLFAEIPDCLVSVDTSKAEVARAALDSGAAIINDVTALTGDAEMADVAAKARAGVVLMHMQGTPRTMQIAPHYEDVVGEVRDALHERTQMAQAAGIAMESLVFDPGIGFGKNQDHNLTLLKHLPQLRPGQRPLLVGVSRKSFLGRIAPTEAPSDRLWPTVALTALMRARGAQIFRVHDVRENVAALRTVEAVLGTES